MKPAYFSKKRNETDENRENWSPVNGTGIRIRNNFEWIKKYIVLIFISFGVLNAFSQHENAVDKKTSREINKKQKMEQRIASEKEMASVVDSLVNQRKFVLEANFLSNQTGNRVIVNSTLNFIIVDSSDITIQIASSQSIGGSNGLGGVTTKGNISKFDVKKSKGYYTIMISAMTTLGSYDIFLNVSPSANTDAVISGLTAGKLNYHGVIKPLNKSRVYKGRSI